MEQLFYAALTSLLFSFLLMPLLVRFLHRKRVLDVGGRRKIHKGFIPSMGGIVICISFIMGVLLWVPMPDILNTRMLFASIGLMFVTGVRDDIAPLRPLHKLFVQIIAAAMVVLTGEINITSLYGLFGVEQIPFWLGSVGSILFIVFITNAFNLLDGIDGLAASIAFVVFSFLCFWFYATGNIPAALFIACIAGAVVGFLYYNWQPASIFMGDTGSLTIGFILSITTLMFISENGKLEVDNLYKFPAVLSAGLTMVLLPVFDTLRVFLLRIRQGKSPFSPDKQHLHHLVWHILQTHASAARAIIFGYIAAGSALLVAARYLPDWQLLLLIVVVCTGIDIGLNRIVGKVLRKERRKNRK